MADGPILLSSLKEGASFAGHLLAREAAYKVSSKGSEYLELRLGDRSGEVKAFLWDLRAIEGDMDAVKADAFLWVKGSLGAYNGRPQMRLDKVKPVRDEDIADLGHFFPVSARPQEEMLAELDACIASISDPWIRTLLERLLVVDPERRAAYAKAPAAKSMHHVCLGGLLEHSLSVARMAEQAAVHYGELNRDLLLAGVLLHDLGKTEELTYERGFGYSDEGNLVGHITMEALWLDRAMMGIPDFPADLRLHLLHLVLSHHGRQDYGSPVVPRTPEALVLHTLDDLDGKLEGMFRLMREEAGEGRWTSYSRALDRTFFRARWAKVDR